MRKAPIAASAFLLASLLAGGCAKKATTAPAEATAASATTAGAKESVVNSPTFVTAEQVSPPQVLDDDKGFNYVTEQFADIRVLRYRVPGFENLSAQQKELLYYLYEAALSGRDIIYDQNFKHNLRIRRTLDAIVQNKRDRSTSPDWEKFMEYTKRVWFSNGIHHHYSANKIMPDFSKEFLAASITKIPSSQLPLKAGETRDAFIKWITPILFDPTIAPKQTNKAAGEDLIKTSAVNFYEGVTQKEVEAFYAKKTDADKTRPVSHGLNSKVVKENGQLVEKVWKADGMYGPAIQRIVFWLEKAVTVAENEKQKLALQKLVQFYRTGDLKVFDEYNIAWVKDVDSKIDVVNGFIEVYDDPIGIKASYESVVSFRDDEATKRIKAIGDQAQWFEDNSPLLATHKKKNVVGITAKVITTVVEGGDAAPATPIGINLPNANWIRKEHGSKSVNLGNIVHAYNESANTGGSTLTEFAFSPEEIERSKKYSSLASDLHTDMHEVIGHASGQINPGVGTPKQTLKNYASTIEEGRADLVALYYVMDPKLVEIGVMPNLEVGKAEYDGYIRGGLITQLSRIAPGEVIEEDHMRNRQMIAAWAFEKGKKDNVIEKVTKNGKTYFKINDYQKLRALFGQLLRETQRITSEGDLAAAKNLVETYGVKVDKALHQEVLQRYATLKIAPYSGFIQPKLSPVVKDGKIVDVLLVYPDNFTQQMLEYGTVYNLLPHYN
ncbi:dihydrofolate reductase [Rufibacter radiotolerans]|uniref:Dihydrofolate reductase n=1 Tax=Rufibacter radiotolerans TaxID=1379910 RepID=A0A0H4VNR6_9BACT|nr:dihydrofolate reductase [Rufibacter radiotolerans]AKQ45379.1 dihydrofolate reductase [Rufibacter radiotolerans]